MSHDTWIHRVVRPAVRPLVGTPITPNHITTLRLVTGLAAAAAFAEGGESWRAWGGGIFLLSMLLDRADGELARLGGMASRRGHTYDLSADAACNTLVFVGLGIGLRSGTFGDWAVPMGILAAVAVAVIFWLVAMLEKRRGIPAGGLSAFAGFDPDDALLVVPLALWSGFAEALLVAAGIGAPAFAIFVYVKFRHGLAVGADGPDR